LHGRKGLLRATEALENITLLQKKVGDGGFEGDRPFDRGERLIQRVEPHLDDRKIVERGGRGGIGGQRAAEIAPRLLQTAHEEVDQSVIVGGGGHIRFEMEGPLVVVLGLLEQAFARQDVAEIEIGDCVGGILAEHLLVAADGLTETAAAEIDDAQVVEQILLGGIEGERGKGGLDRLIVLLMLLVDLSLEQITHGGGRSKFDDALGRGEGIVLVAQIGISLGEIADRPEVIGPQPDSRLIIGERRIKLPEMIKGDAEVVVRDRIIGGERNGLAE